MSNLEIKCQFPIDILYKILSYNDDYSIKQFNHRIMIYEPKYKLLLNDLNLLCALTNHNSVKQWRIFNRVCMKHLYKKCNYHDFHMLLNQLSESQLIEFIEIETIHMLHHLSINYHNYLNYIHKINYPNIKEEDKRIIYVLFWDYCKFYFMNYNQLIIKEHTHLL